MKDIKSSKKTSFLKKLFIKICRKLGYEIIDQNSFELVTSNKILTDDLSKLGLNSINLPLGEVKVTRKVKALDIIVRTCASVNMLTQNKTRLFEEQKIEYTLKPLFKFFFKIPISLYSFPNILATVVLPVPGGPIKAACNEMCSVFKFLFFFSCSDYHD